MDNNEEVQNLLKLFNNDLLKAIEYIERQLNTLYTRAQVLLSLAGVAVTVTGFSGRIIASTNLASQLFIIGGLAVIICSVIYIFTTVMSIKWVSSIMDPLNPVQTVLLLLERRNVKTKAYTRGGRILCLGLILYAVAVAIMLLNPEPLVITAR